jgi:hypothetical protein
MVSNHGAAVASAPNPIIPAVINKASMTLQVNATQNTWARRNPWRNTNAFCAPIARIKDKLMAKPDSKDVMASPDFVRLVMAMRWPAQHQSKVFEWHKY